MKTIFVSSTFKDMHFERDAIQEITLPILKSEAIQYGENVSFCDLRWGINTGELDSEEGARKVLDVCLDEIDRCKPPMVVILGDRYGWIPSEALTKNAAERKKMELEDLQISVTALEIAYGALSTPERREQTLFYFRSIELDCPREYAAEDLEHEEKLNKLKADIERLTGGRIKRYTVHWDGDTLTGVIPFAKMLAEDIKQVLLPEWREKEKQTPFERERQTHWSFIEEKNAMFSARDILVQTFFDDLTLHGQNFLSVKAPSGSGKSMLFSRLAWKLREASYHVLPFICGLTPESNDSADILRNTIFYLEELLGIDHRENPDVSFESIASKQDSTGSGEQSQNSFETMRERLSQLCVECERRDQRVYIMVDAVDQLVTNDQRDSLIFIPERLSDHVKFIMTGLPELQTAGYPFVTIEPLDVSERRMVVDGILQSHHRQIEDSVIEKILAVPGSENPLYISLLIQRLLMMNHEDFEAIESKQMDSMKAISARQMEILENCPETVQDMSALLLEEAGKRINPGLVGEIYKYLAVSRYGLRQEDLAVLCGKEWSALDFAHFIMYMNESFIIRDDGRFDFSHMCIREGIMNTSEIGEAQHKEIAEYFYGVLKDDSVRCQEMVYHCLRANDTELFLKVISEESSRNSHAMKDVYEFSMRDGGECVLWALRVAEGDTRLRLSEFISNTFIRSGTASQLATSSRILEENIKQISQTESSGTEPGLCLAISLAYFQYAELFGWIDEGVDPQKRYGDYQKSIEWLRIAKEAAPGMDIRFDLSKRFHGIGETYKRGDDTRNEALDYYKQEIAILEDLYTENASNRILSGLSNAYTSIGRLYAMYAENKDYLWKAVSYFKHAMSLVSKEYEDPSFYLDKAIAYHSLARVYMEEENQNENVQRAFELYGKAIEYFEKLLWKDKNEELWFILMGCYYEKGSLLARMVNRIDEEKNAIAKVLKEKPFDASLRDQHLTDARECFARSLLYYDKLVDVGHEDGALLQLLFRIHFWQAGAMALARDDRYMESLEQGKATARRLESRISDTQLFSLYYETMLFFIGATKKNRRMLDITTECLARMNDMLPGLRDEAGPDERQAIAFVEMTLHGFSRQYGKMLKCIPGLVFGAIAKGFQLKKVRIHSKTANRIDAEIRRDAPNNRFRQQDDANRSTVFSTLSFVGNIVVLLSIVLARILSPLLMRWATDPRIIMSFLLGYETLAIVLSGTMAVGAVAALILSIRSKGSNKKRAVLGVCMGAAALCMSLLILNGNNYFDKQYEKANELMEKGEYEEAASLFESLYDFEKSEDRLEACKNAILQKKYEQAVALLEEGRVKDAYEQLMDLQGYKDSEEIADSVYGRYVLELLRSAQVGDRVVLGTYEQDNDRTNREEPIEWMVLDKQKDMLLVISKYALECKPYGNTPDDVTWENSTLREWMNTEFFASAFLGTEKDLIIPVETIAQYGDVFPSGADLPKQDRLFLLSQEEANSYFQSNDSRACKATAYAISLGAGRGGSQWWLRTPGNEEGHAMHVWSVGGINTRGTIANENQLTVRPAMWLLIPQ